MDRIGVFFHKDLKYMMQETASQIKILPPLRQLMLSANLIKKYWNIKASAENHTMYQHTGPSSLLLENIVFLIRTIRGENCVSGVLCIAHRSMLFTYNFNSRYEFLEKVRLTLATTMPVAYVTLNSTQVLELLYKTLVENRDLLKLKISYSPGDSRTRLTDQELLSEQSKQLLIEQGLWLTSKFEPQVSRLITWSVLQRHLSSILSMDLIIDSWKEQMLEVIPKLIASLSMEQTCLRGPKNRIAELTRR